MQNSSFLVIKIEKTDTSAHFNPYNFKQHKNNFQHHIFLFTDIYRKQQITFSWKNEFYDFKRTLLLVLHVLAHKLLNTYTILYNTADTVLKFLGVFSTS